MAKRKPSIDVDDIDMQEEGGWEEWLNRMEQARALKVWDLAEEALKLGMTVRDRHMVYLKGGMAYEAVWTPDPSGRFQTVLDDAPNVTMLRKQLEDLPE